MRRTARLAALGLPLALLLSACGGSDPYASGESAGEGEAVVVGSANFPESTLLGNIYAQALKDAGVKVETQFNIGSREVYFKQVKSGALSVFPEYNGGILFYLDPEATADTTKETNAAIQEELPESLRVLESSTAQNKDSLTVTSETASEYELKSISDLKGVAGELTLGGPPEFETRAQGVVGLKDVYGLEFGDFRSLQPSLTAQALKDGDIQVANLFTTDPAIVANDFVVLEDPKSLFGAQNVTPLVHKGTLKDAGREALNAVSAELTTDTLTELNRRVSQDHEKPEDVAADWLKSVGLVG